MKKNTKEVKHIQITYNDDSKKIIENGAVFSLVQNTKESPQGLFEFTPNMSTPVLKSIFTSILIVVKQMGWVDEKEEKKHE